MLRLAGRVEGDAAGASHRPASSVSTLTYVQAIIRVCGRQILLIDLPLR